MEQPYAPVITHPNTLSDEAAAQLLNCLYEITRALECLYASQLHRHYNAIDQRQQDLWPEQDPPF